MNRDEKNLQTRQKIINSALQEFSEKSYGEASLNMVCAAGTISKGIIYHYFRDKDELYLTCIRECFDALTGYLTNVVSMGSTSIEASLENYFDARIAFLEAHPIYLKLFCNAIMNPPTHLVTPIAEITAGFDALNISVLTKLLENVKLCPDVTIGEVVDVFCQYQDFVNVRFQMQTFGESTLKEHEERCRRSLRILLYGVVEREGNV